MPNKDGDRKTRRRCERGQCGGAEEVPGQSAVGGGWGSFEIGDALKRLGTVTVTVAKAQ